MKLGKFLSMLDSRQLVEIRLRRFGRKYSPILAFGFSGVLSFTLPFNYRDYRVYYSYTRPSGKLVVFCEV